MNESLMKHGAFSWNELMTPDVDAARSFYGALFGWTFEDFLGAGAPYMRISLMPAIHFTGCGSVFHSVGAQRRSG